MNIFVLNHSFCPQKGGIEQYNFQNISYLLDAGHKVFLYSLDPEIPWKDHPGLTVVSEGVPKLKGLNRLIRRYSPVFKLSGVKLDRIFCCHLHLLPSVMSLSKIKKTPVTLFLYGIDCWGDRLKEYRSYLDFVDCFISIGSFTTEQIVKQGVPKEKIHYFPPLIPKNFLLNTPAKEKEEVFTLITVGRLSSQERYKGHDLVLEALSFIKLKNPELKMQYWIVGRGDDLPRIKDLVKRYLLEDWVTLWGFVTDEALIDLYQRSHVFIMPSRVKAEGEVLEGEGFGIVFIEASRFHLALIGPNEGGPVDIIEHEKNGLIIDPRSVLECSEAIMKLYQSPQLREDLALKAKESLTEKFSNQRMKEFFAPIL